MPKARASSLAHGQAFLHPVFLQVPYSEFLSAVEASPARVRFVRMGELRWEFGLVVPREHPVKGVPVDESADAKAGSLG